ncbi:MAG: hypothetical protein ACP5JJ_15110 [Anaerolineae bacterium]
MNLKLRRLVRTPSSEQYALFDLDRTNEDYDPLSLGKIDLHYTDEGIYGTFLLWQEAIGDLPSEQIQRLVETLLQEMCEPMGLPTFYAIEFFSPTQASYLLYSCEDTRGDNEAGRV